MDYKSQIDTTKLPLHVAVIMDGNGRWAKQQDLGNLGHHNGVSSVRETAGSSPNWELNTLLYTLLVPKTGIAQKTR